MKTEVYSWRVSADLKAGLEREAVKRKLSLSAVLDQAARDWLNKGEADPQGDEEQVRLHNAASECFGAFAGSNPHRAETSRETVRQRLKRRHER
jgi:hypothetical protein